MSLTRQNAHEIRDKFLSEIDPAFHFNRLFDHLPGILFFAKNDEGRILFANTGLVQLYGFASEREFIGRTDFEVLPKRLAEKYRADDMKILSSGQAMHDIVELFVNPQGIPEWYLTTKLPIYSRGGKVIGVMGTIREYRGAAVLEGAFQEIGAAADFMRTHFREGVSVKTLAKKTSLSVRQFERKFRSAFNISPHQYLIKLRVHAACDLLREGRLPVSDIAMDLGFTDQSAMARHFKKNMGFTPLQYRKKYM